MFFTPLHAKAKLTFDEPFAHDSSCSYSGQIHSKYNYLSEPSNETVTFAIQEFTTPSAGLARRLYSFPASSRRRIYVQSE